jgi:hypothetical protein
MSTTPFLESKKPPEGGFFFADRIKQTDQNVCLAPKAKVLLLVKPSARVKPTSA